MNAYLGYDQGESVRPLVQTMITRYRHCFLITLRQMIRILLFKPHLDRRFQRDMQIVYPDVTLHMRRLARVVKDFLNLLSQIAVLTSGVDTSHIAN